MAKPPPFAVTLFVNDLDKTREYFSQTLGFQEYERFEGPDGRVTHATMTFGRGPTAPAVSLGPIDMIRQSENYDFGEFGRKVLDSPQTLGNGVLLYFTVPNVDKYYAKIEAKGAIIDEPPTDQFWGDRTISVLTPDNIYMTFATPIKGFKVPEEMGTLVRASTPRRAKPKSRKAARGKARKARR